MNIHFTDLTLFEKLKTASIVRIRFGSYLYGTMTEKSDIDYLYIYRTSNSELNSFLNSQHQLQFKEVIDGKEIDHNFVSLHTFIRNLLNGDSTVNFEVLFSEDMKNSLELNFLYEMRFEFINYSLVRSYLGLARRDLKFYHKQKTDYDRKKSVIHALRGLEYSKMLITKNFDLTCFKNRLIEIDVENKFRFDVEKEISKVRDEFNLNWKSNFDKYISVENSRKLDAELNSLMDSKYWQEKTWDLNMDYFYKAFESWVDYE